MDIFKIFINLFRFDRANWKAVALCILTAIVFWIFNALNKNYSTNIRFPLLFEFDGEKFAPADHLPKTVSLNVSGNGWELFRKYVGVKVPPVIIPLERPHEVRKILGSSLIPLLASQVGSLKINFVVTDTLHLQIDERDTHHYRLTADLSRVTFKEGYGRISPVVVLPDSVKLNGPQRWLHQLGDSVKLVVTDKNISENFREEVEVEFEGSAFVRRDPSVAQVMFEVGPVEEVTRKLKVQADHLVKGVSPDTVTVHFQIPSSQRDDFNSLRLDLQVSARDLKKNKWAIPKALNVPPYAILLAIDTVRIVGHP